MLAMSDAGAAETACRRAIELAPERAGQHCLLGEVLRELGRLDEAEDALRAALRCDREHFRTHTALGNLMRTRLDMDSARRHYEAALRRKPDSALARWNLGLLDLFEGRFKRGWEGYAAGVEAGQRTRRPFAYPPWRGETALDGALLVYAEQGLGDEIMFASCVPDLVARGVQCVLECDPRLTALFERSFGGVLVKGVDRGDHAWQRDLPVVAAQAGSGDLPGFLRRERGDFPSRPGYLRADPRRVRSWTCALQELGPGLRVGISWRGGGRAADRRERSVPYEAWRRLAETPGIVLVAAQYDRDPVDREGFRRAGVEPAWLEGLDPVRDVDGLAALLCAVDLLITVDNSSAHLCGALGRPGWVLLAPSPDWRWLVTGDHSPWYPGLKLFRSAHGSGWDEVIGRVAGEARPLAGREDCR